MKKFISVLASILLLMSLSNTSFALSLDQAKSQGLIGENSLGYLASVSTKPSSEVQTLINSINSKRKAAYIKKAAKAGVSSEVIAKRVSQRLFNKASAGSYLMNSSGKWYRK